MKDDILIPPRGMIRSRPRPVASRPVFVRPRVGMISDMVYKPAPSMPSTLQPKVAEEPSVNVRNILQSPDTLGAFDAISPLRIKRKAYKPRRKLTTKELVGVILIVGVLITTGYVSIDTWMTNNKLREATGAQATKPVDKPVTQENEGKDEAPISSHSIEDYKVAADMPRVLTINKINVKARVMPMSANRDGSMQAPQGIFDSGWYSASAKPGTPGAAVIDGHASGPTREGLFAYLDKLVVGDTLSIERGNGTKLTYKVIHTDVVPVDKVDMDKLMLPYGAKAESLNLITCTGKWVQGGNTYDHRVLVFTERVS